jgi:hypothetical protein
MDRIGSLIFSSIWVDKYFPQHCIFPLTNRTQAWSKPVAIAIPGPLSPFTDTGTVLFDLDPSPNSPSLLSPQHFTSPPFIKAHENLMFMETANAPPAISEGAYVSVSVGVTVFVGINIGVIVFIATGTDPNPTTVSGITLPLWVPSPSWP